MSEPKNNILESFFADCLTQLHELMTRVVTHTQPEFEVLLRLSPKGLVASDESEFHRLTSMPRKGELIRLIESDKVFKGYFLVDQVVHYEHPAIAVVFVTKPNKFDDSIVPFLNADQSHA